MSKETALAIAQDFIPEYEWTRAKLMHNGGWIIRSKADDENDGIPGVYVSPGGEPDIIGSAPSMWPEAVVDEYKANRDNSPTD